MTARSITLPRWLFNRLRDEARRTPGIEVCGLIGHRKDSYQVYPIINIADTPQARFQLDPAEQIDAMRRMRERGEDLFAIYHSHPGGPARPSQIDLDEAAYPEALYLIIALEEKDNPEIRGYWIEDGTAHEVEMRM